MNGREAKRQPDQADATPAAPAPAPPAAMPVQRVLALQRAAGNQAVVGMLRSRGPVLSRQQDAGVPPIAGVPNPREDFQEHIRGRRYEQAAHQLATIDAQERRDIVNGMNSIDLLRVARAAEAAGLFELRNELAEALEDPRHANAAVREAEAELDEALGRADWAGATMALHRLPPGDRTRRLGTLALTQLTSLAPAARRLGAAYRTTAEEIERRRVEKLGQDYEAALNGSQWGQAVVLLNAYNDADLQTRARALTPAQLPAMETAARTVIPAIGDRVYRTIRFVRYGPAAATTHAPEYTVTTPGTEVHHAAVGGGDVRVRTGVQAQLGTRALPEAYEMEYSGPDSAKTRWLQFIWREIYREEDWWPDGYLDDAITTTGGSYNLTTDASRPNYNTDSAPSAGSPFYEAGGADLRGPTTTTMLDMPSPLQHIVLREFNRGADRITSRAHFSTYLVRDMQVLYRVDLTVQWVFERSRHYNAATRSLSGTPARTQTVDRARTVDRLDPRMRARLVDQYPTYDYLP